MDGIIWRTKVRWRIFAAYLLGEVAQTAGRASRRQEKAEGRLYATDLALAAQASVAICYGWHGNDKHFAAAARAKRWARMRERLALVPKRGAAAA